MTLVNKTQHTLCMANFRAKCFHRLQKQGQGTFLIIFEEESCICFLKVCIWLRRRSNVCYLCFFKADLWNSAFISIHSGSKGRKPSKGKDWKDWAMKSWIFKRYKIEAVERKQDVLQHTSLLFFSCPMSDLAAHKCHVKPCMLNIHKVRYIYLRSKTM